MLLGLKGYTETGVAVEWKSSYSSIWELPKFVSHFNNSNVGEGISP